MVPAEHGIRCDEVRDFLQGLLPQLVADLSQGLALTVAQPEAPLDLAAQDAILRHQVLVAQQEFLIDGPRDICQQMFPVHRLSPTAFTVHIAGEYG